MPGQKTVSIIIPVYNGEKYLKTCLDSVFAQKLEQMQVICVNDGSTDGSLQILREYQKDHPDMEIISQENRGLSASRNAGLDKATGEYVQFLDCDDSLHPDALKCLYERAKRDGLDMLFFDGTTVYEDTSFQSGYDSYSELYRTKITIRESVLSGEQLFVKLVDGGSYRSSACMYLLRREYLMSIGVRFLPGIYYEDNLFTLECILLARKCGVEAKPFYLRLIREDSIVTMKKNFQHARGGYISQTCMQSFLLSHHFSKDTIRCARQICNTLMNAAINCYAGLSAAEKEEALANHPEAMLIDDALQTDYLLTAPAAKCYDGAGKRPVVETTSRALFDSEPYQEQTPYVSVIIPVYNAERFLPETIGDLRNQTLNNFEMLFVDDGSTDQSLEILKQAAQQDPRIRILHQQNRYAGEARNNGMDHACGKYLLFLDADDRFEPDLISNAYACAEANEAQIVLFHADILQMPEGKRVPAEYLCPCHRLPTGVFSGKDGKEHIFDVLNPWTKLYSRSYIQELGIRYQALFSSNDLYFSMVAMACAEKIVPLPKVLVHYRTGTGDSIQARKTKAPLDTYHAFIGVKEELVKRNVYEIFKTPFAVKAAESMLRTLDTMKNLDAYRKLYEALHDRGMKDLDVPCVSVADMQHISAGADKLRRCCKIISMEFDEYCLDVLTEAAVKRTASAHIRYGYREVLRLQDEVKALRGSYAYRIGTKITKPLHILRQFIYRYAKERREPSG